MKICPYCEQDCIWLVQIKLEPRHDFLMCFECDAVWRKDQVVDAQQGTTFDRRMQALGRKPDWQDIEKIRRLE